MRKRALTMTILAVLFVTTSSLTAMAAKKTTRHAVIECEGKWTYNWDTGETEFSDNCRVEITGEDRAVMTANQISVKFAEGGFEITQMRAAGPVTLHIVTQPDDKGVSRVVDAKCHKEATFTGESRIIRLTGEAEVTMKMEPHQPGVKPAILRHCKWITVDLETQEVEAQGDVGKPLQMEADIPTQQHKPDQKGAQSEQ